jgi:hypothetical protein
MVRGFRTNVIYMRSLKREEDEKASERDGGNSLCWHGTLNIQNMEYRSEYYD